VSEGENTVSVKATDLDNEQTSKQWHFTVPAAGAAFEYDQNGNLKSDGQRTFTWDAANRLTGVSGASGSVGWEYDAFDRRVRQTDTPTGEAAKTRILILQGTTIIELRDSSNNEIRRCYPEGQEWELNAGGITKLHYTRDHLGSIRELVDEAGIVRARYDYDTWGKRTKINGDLDADFSYTGHYWNSIASLNLAYYRAYDPSMGRWLSGDPIGENGGSNLYNYVFGSPVNFTDSLGLSFDTLPTNQDDFATSVDYLQQEPNMKRIINKLKKSPIVYKIRPLKDKKHSDSYNPSNHTIYWDPHSALRTTCGGSQTPALGLGHEMSHAARPEGLLDILIGMVPAGDYDDREEKRVITGPETTAAKTLGEGVRTDHRGTPYPVLNPISTLPFRANVTLRP
jgi:RHS repeat-associated protein